jgi:hypothetical protein
MRPLARFDKPGTGKVSPAPDRVAHGLAGRRARAGIGKVNRLCVRPSGPVTTPRTRQRLPGGNLREALSHLWDRSQEIELAVFP